MEKRYTKSTLPEKDCAACGWPFAWRKKWARDWDDVKTCSERCKSELRRRERKIRIAASKDCNVAGNASQSQSSAGAGAAK